jgi:tRNA pseudouridine38-40 synthase
MLPPEIAVLRSEPAPDGFDARRDARSRTYCYWVIAGPVRNPLEVSRALWWPYPVDTDALEGCASALVGTHDFTAFTPTRTEHVRFEREVMRAEWRAHPLGEPFPGRLLEFWIEADAFMRHMVRVLVGTMLEVAAGRRTPDDFGALLDGAPRDRAGETTPAHGLYLASIRY